MDTVSTCADAGTPATPGACFGYRVRSTLPFEYLRSGRGDPLDVVSVAGDAPSPEGRLVIAWTPRDRHMLDARLHRTNNVYHLWIARAGWFTIEPMVPRITVPADLDPIRREELLWTIPAALCLLQRGDLPLHAAAVEVGGEAVILAAPGGSGKTTLAAAFHNAGSRVLSEDLTCLRPSPAPSVVPGPAVLRVRPDVLGTIGVTGARVVADTPTRVSLSLAPSRRGDMTPVPIRAVVLLRTSDTETRLDRLSVARALVDVWAVTFQIPGDSDSGRCFTGIVDLVRTVPVWNLHRPLRADGWRRAVDQIGEVCVSRG